MKNKAIILDLGGILLNDDKKISPFNREMINRCIRTRFQIIIATARPLRYVKNILPKELGTVYLVLYNGSWIFKNGDIIYKDELDSKTVMSHVYISTFFSCFRDRLYLFHPFL